MKTILIPILTLASLTLSNCTSEYAARAKAASGLQRQGVIGNFHYVESGADRESDFTSAGTSVYASTGGLMPLTRKRF